MEEVNKTIKDAYKKFCEIDIDSNEDPLYKKNLIILKIHNGVFTKDESYFQNIQDLIVKNFGEESELLAFYKYQDGKLNRDLSKCREAIDLYVKYHGNRENIDVANCLK